MSERRYPLLADGEWLRLRYVEEEASLDDMVAEIGCQKSTLRKALAARLTCRGGREDAAERCAPLVPRTCSTAAVTASRPRRGTRARTTRRLSAAATEAGGRVASPF